MFLSKKTFSLSCFITKYHARFSELLNDIPIISSSIVFNPVVSVSKEKWSELIKSLNIFSKEFWSFTKIKFSSGIAS